MPDGSTLKLDPNSNLKVEGIIQKKGEAFRGSSYFVLTVGGVMVDVVKKFAGPPSVEIETTNAISFGVRGTTFYIINDKETSDVWATVRHGKIQAMDYLKDDSDEIATGMAMAVVEGQTMTKPMKYKWTEKIKWSFAEKDDFLNTDIDRTVEDRIKELQANFKIVRDRKKKKFKSEHEKQKKNSGDAYRTSTGQYEVHDAGLYNSSVQGMEINYGNPGTEKETGDPYGTKPKGTTVDQFDGGTVSGNPATDSVPTANPIVDASGNPIGDSGEKGSGGATAGPSGETAPTDPTPSTAPPTASPTPSPSPTITLNTETDDFSVDIATGSSSGSGHGGAIAAPAPSGTVSPPFNPAEICKMIHPDAMMIPTGCGSYNHLDKVQNPNTGEYFYCCLNIPSEGPFAD